MNKKALINHLHYYFWLYAVVFVAVIVFWYFLFSALAKPAANERLNLTFIGININDKGLQEHLTENIPKISEQTIKKSEVEQLTWTDDYNMNLTLLARSNGNSDIIIIEESTISEKNISLGAYFAELEKAKVKSYFGEETEVYEQNGKVYGVCIYDGEKANNFSDYYTGNVKCWAFITPASHNAAKWNGEGKEEDAVALEVLKYLTGDR